MICRTQWKHLYRIPFALEEQRLLLSVGKPLILVLEVLIDCSALG